MRREAFALVVALGMAFAGCVQSQGGTDDVEPPGGADWAARAVASGHDHADLSLHRGLSTPNFRVVGHSPLVSEAYGTTVQGNLCGDAGATRDGRRLAVVESRGDVAFSVADVTDAARPQWLGEFLMERTYVYDLALVPDGLHVVLVTSQTKSPDRADGPSRLMWRSPCAEGGLAAWHVVPGPPVAANEDPVPRPSSVILVSIEDPAAPRIVDQVPVAGFGHGVSATDVDGRLVVASAGLACAPTVGCRSQAASFHFLEVVEGPLGEARLEHLSILTPPTTESVEPGYPEQIGHNDAWIAKHPITGRWLAYLAAWDLGLIIADVTDPAEPVIVSSWTDHDPDLPDMDRGNVHSAAPLPGLIGDRHFTVIGPENPSRPEATPAGIVRVLDTTDPAAPTEAAAWVLPLDVEWEERLQWSPHYLAVSGETAFVSHYHAGVWALDLSGLRSGEWHALPAVGVFMPDRDSPAPPERPFRWTPTVEEVHAFADGTLLTFDSNSGLYAFEFDASAPAAPPEPWDLGPAHAP